MSNEGAARRGGGEEIVGLGLVVVDLLAVVDAYPEVDSKQDVQTSRIQVGGPVPTALAQLRRFGHRCRFLGWWGDDALGSVIEQDFEVQGIPTDPGCRCRGVETGHSQVWIEKPTGRRTSVTRRPPVASRELSDRDRRWLKSARVVHLDGWPTDQSLEAARLAKAGGALVVVDTGSPKPGIDDVLRCADVVTAPRRFVEEFAGCVDLAAGAIQIAELGPSLVCVTDGDQGAVGAADGTVWATRALNGAPAVDTNGAGDVFAAGVIHGVLQDWAPERVLQFATVTAGLKCRKLGNRDALPELSGVLRTIPALSARV